MAAIQEWISSAPSHRVRRSMRGVFTKFLNDDDPTTFKALTFGASATPISLAGAFTTGISIAADGTTAIAVTSAFTGTTGFSFAGTATDGIKISGACVDAIEISGANTAYALNISGNQTGSAIHVGGTWKLGFSDAAISIGSDATVAFGSVADTICLERFDVSAQMGAAEKYVMGRYMTLGTSGAGAGTVLQHGIWIGDYAKITVAHDTTDAYATRGRTVLGGTLAGNQFIGVMGQVEITGAATLEATGGGYGVYGSITSSGSGASNRHVAAGYFTLRPNTINLAGEQNCIVADMGGSGYADYGLLATCGNNNLGQALIGLRCTDSAVVPSGIKFDFSSGSITHALEFSATGGCLTTQAADVAGDNTSHKLAIDIGGSTYYLAIWSSAWS
jgi:hypothetical protein